MFNKKVLLSLLVIGVVAATAGAGTWAAFSDVETSTDNTFTAGTLDLKVEGADAITSVSIENVCPGDSEETEVDVQNYGTISGDLTLNITDVVNDGGVYTEAEGTDNTGDLGDNLIIVIEHDSEEKFNGTLSNFNNPLDLGPLDGGEEKDFDVKYIVPEDVGNEIQGDEVTFDLELHLDQQ